MWGMGSASSSESAARASVRLALALVVLHVRFRLWTVFHSSAGLFDRSGHFVRENTQVWDFGLVNC